MSRGVIKEWTPKALIEYINTNWSDITGLPYWKIPRKGEPIPDLIQGMAASYGFTDKEFLAAWNDNFYDDECLSLNEV